MSNLHAATKVADQLISRLFDHRQFTSGEINYLVKQLGESADLEENFGRVLKINQDACVISDVNENVLCKSGDQILKDIFVQVNSLNERAERILKLEDEFKASSLGDKKAEQERIQQECDKDVGSKQEGLVEAQLPEQSAPKQ